MARAAQRGVACRVLADAVGSRRLFRRLAPYLRQRGVRIFPALPANLWRLPFKRLDLRNHRKLAVIDGRVAFTGSQNIVEASYGHKRAGVWHDIMARITGPVVRQLQGIFLEDWFYETGELLEDAALFPSCPPDGPIAVQVVPTGPDQPTELFQDLIVRAIFLARRRVVITSPYFIPNEATLLAMRLAALRGVEVDLVIPKRSDHRLVNAAGSFYCEYLMRYGVRVFLFQQGMLHAKTLTVDDELAMFGSANYDIRSFALNFELNLFVHARRGGAGDAPLAAGLSRPIDSGHVRRLALPHAAGPAEGEPRQALQPAAVAGDLPSPHGRGAGGEDLHASPLSLWERGRG